MRTRREVLGLMAGAPLLLNACGDADDDPLVERARGEDVFQKASEWLWRRRKKDGSWSSERPGLTTGQLLTPLCLLSSTDLPRDDFAYPRQDAMRATDWIIDRRSVTGALGFWGDSAEQPTRSTALAMQALHRLRPSQYMDNAAQFLWWLRRQQLTERNGFPNHPMRGAFGQGLWRRASPGDDLRPTLGLTRVAVQAIDCMYVDADDPAMREALGFLARCRTPSGGFVATPQLVGSEGSGLATADAVLALVSMDHGRDVPLSDELLTDLDVLRAMHRLDEVPGAVSPGEASGRRHYYLAAAASVFERVGGPAGWADDLVRILAAEQAEDGSFAGASGHGEEEPLVATSYALTALGGALRSWPVRKERRR